MSARAGATTARGLRRHLAGAAGLLVSAAALYVALRGVALQSALTRLQHADPVPLLAVLGVIGVQLMLRTIRWRALLAIAHPAKAVRLAALFQILLIGYLGNAVLPARLGEAVRAYLAARRERLDPGVVFGTVVLERVLDTASLAVLAFGAALVVGAPAWLKQAAGLAALAACVVVAGLLAGGVGLLARVLVRGERLLPARALAGLGSLLRFVRFVAAGADASRERPAAALALAISGACWLLDAGTFWLVGQSLGLSLAPGAALLIAAVTLLGTALPSAPGYLGTFELAAAGTATALGVPASAAFSLAVLAHVMAVVPTALGGAAALGASGMGMASISSGARAVRPSTAVASE